VITNIEWEHVDYYKDLADVQSAFRELAQIVPETGCIIANITDPNVAPVLNEVKARVVDYRPYIDLSLKLRQPGMHNRQNAAGAIAVAHYLGIDPQLTADALENFAGTWRRFEYKGDVNGTPVYDDYGHHPTELRATFLGARDLYPGRRLKVVFQSHTYSRTHALFADFVDALALADEVFLLPIYAAREENTWGVTSEQMVEALQTKGIMVHFYHTIPACAEAVRASLSYAEKEVVIAIGAGAVTEVARDLTK
jgi:UDP-N-acetylmuramate--alanine ligase